MNIKWILKKIGFCCITFTISWIGLILLEAGGARDDDPLMWAFIIAFAISYVAIIALIVLKVCCIIIDFFFPGLISAIVTSFKNDFKTEREEPNTSFDFTEGFETEPNTSFEEPFETEQAEPKQDGYEKYFEKNPHAYKFYQNKKKQGDKKAIEKLFNTIRRLHPQWF